MEEPDAQERATRLLASARSLIGEGKPAEAELLCQEAVALAPASVDAWNELANAAVRLIKAAEANEITDRALALDPGNDRAWFTKGAALQMQGRHEDALAALAHVASNGGLDRYAGLLRATSLNALKRYEDLRAETWRLTGRYPQEAQAWYWNGVAHYRLDAYNSALVAFVQATRLAPKNARSWAMRAWALHGMKRHDEALKACEFALSLAPDDSDAWRLKAHALLDLRHDDEAVAAYDRLVALASPNAGDLHNRGLALARLGRYIASLDSLNAALTMAPGSAARLNTIGTVFARFQYLERALAMYERARALDERAIYAWINTGEAYVQLGRLEEARAALTRAAEMEVAKGLELPSPYLATWLGVLHLRQGQLHEAATAFKDALGADPDNDEALAGYAGLLSALGEHARAVETIERVTTLGPHDARHWLEKARILRAAGDTTGADAAEAHAQALLAEQRTALAAWEAAHPGWPGAVNAGDTPDERDTPDANGDA